MRFERWSERCVDFAQSPNCSWLLRYLTAEAHIEVLSRKVWFDGCIEAEFLYRGVRFTLDCPISSPMLAAAEECSESTWEELLAHIRACPEWDPWLPELVKRLWRGLVSAAAPRRRP